MRKIAIIIADKFHELWVRYSGGWKDVEGHTPPEQWMYVMDESGNIAHAQPTWYRFKETKKDPTRRGSWLNTKITHCEYHWDGGWLIAAGLDFKHPLVGDVVKYKLISKR